MRYRCEYAVALFEMTSDRFVAAAPIVKEKFVLVLGALVPENVWAAVGEAIAMADATATASANFVFINFA